MAASRSNGPTEFSWKWTNLERPCIVESQHPNDESIGSLKLLMVLERLTGEESCFLQSCFALATTSYRVPFDPFRLVGIASWRDEGDKDSGVDMGSSMDIEKRNMNIGTDNWVDKEGRTKGIGCT